MPMVQGFDESAHRVLQATPNRLRFELSGGGAYIPMFARAYDRARHLARAALAEGPLLAVVAVIPEIWSEPHAVRKFGPQMDVFDTAPFLYDQAALDHILDFLSHEKLSNLETEDSNLVANQQKIEATQLQIICDAIEKRVKARHLQIVQLGDVGNLEGIIEQYYDNQIHALDKSEQLPARRFIEEGLVFEEEERRLSLYEGQIFKTYKVKPETLQQLVDSHLLRAEPNMSGGYTYELSHDTLVTPVLKAKNLRLDAERKIADAEAKQERDAELAQARRLAEVERMRRRRSNIFLIIATIGLGIAIWQFIAATRAKEQAELLRQNFEQQKDDAYKAKGLAEAAQNAAIISDSLAQIAKLKADIAARQAKSAEQEANKQRDEAQKQKDIADKRLKEMQELQIAKYKTSAQRMVEMGKYKIARQILNEALKLDPLNEKVLAELKKLNN